jgi:outer membrane protein assembly factor BamB
MKNILLVVLLISPLYPQQQVDIPWPTLADSPWPMIKHDPQFTGRSPYRGPQSPTITWTVNMKDGIFSGPVIGEDKNLYFGSYYQDPAMLGLSDYFYCFSSDADTVWNYKLGRHRPPQSGILIDSSNIIYFGSLDGYLYALYPDGTLKWEFKTSGPIVESAIPNIDLQGNIYITDGWGELYSVRPGGNLNWNVKYENGFTQRSPAFSPDGNTIYIAGRDSNLFALDLDGGLKWKFSCGVIQKAPMIDSNGNIYFIPYYPQFFYSINSEGNIRWKSAVNSVGYAISTIDKQGNLYFIAIDSLSFPDKALFSLDYYGNFRWSHILNDYENDDFWQPLICDFEGTVYIGSTFGYYYYAISSNGQLKWKLPLNEYQVDNTGAISEDGTLYLGVHKSSLVTSLEKTLIAIRDTVTSVKIDNKEIISYSLEQNYPNPFNSRTSIRYTIIQPDRVAIRVFNLLGEEIAVILDRYQEKGEYEVIFQPKDLSSGIYFYTLNSGRFNQTKKLILLK